MYFRVLKGLTVGGLSGICAFVGFKKLNGAVIAENIDKGSEQVPGKVLETGARDPVSHEEICAIPDNMQLILVQIFFRHGARTPTRLLKTLDMTYDEKFHDRAPAHTDVPYVVRELSTGGPQPKSIIDENQMKLVLKGGMKSGQLTAMGRDQAYLLGQKLKKRYIEELGYIESYNSSDIFVRSTNYNRCVQSLRCVVAGMFGLQNFKDNGPLVIPVCHMNDEDLYADVRACGTLQKFVSICPSLLMKIQPFADAVSKVRTNIGQDPEMYINMLMVRDNLIAGKSHGLQLPKWLLETETEISKAALQEMEYFVCGRPDCRNVFLSLSCGRIYDMIGRNMKDAIEDSKSVQKLHLYSCHDTSLYPLLVALEYPFDQWPPYVADLKYELYQDHQKQTWVKISYCGEDFTPPGCNGPLIPFTKFQEMIKPYTLTHDQYNLNCKNLNLVGKFECQEKDKK